MLATYSIPEFYGIDEGTNENRMAPGMAPLAENMDTTDGALKVGQGFRRYGYNTTTQYGNVLNMHYWHLSGKTDRIIIGCEHGLFAYIRDPEATSGTWKKLFLDESDPHLMNATYWDFCECRIGNKEYILMACGGTYPYCIFKWDGVSANIDIFGTGQYLIDTTITGWAPSFPHVGSAGYMYSAGEVTYSISYDSTFWNAGQCYAFTVPRNTPDADNMVIRVTSNGTTMAYDATFVPIWSAGDTAVVRCVTINGTRMLEPCEETYPWGASVVLTSGYEITPEIKQRILDVGIIVDGVSIEVENVFDTGIQEQYILKETYPGGFKNDATIQVRGGNSIHPVQYLEMYYDRLFAAGDSTAGAESRLYWSQPPGGVRSIEDWSMDDASPDTGGGFVEVGDRSSGRITGLYALPNQLLIFKERGIFRLLGDRPSNFRIVPVQIGSEAAHGIVSNKGIPFWITRGGLQYFDGQNAGTVSNARQIKKTLEEADLTFCSSVVNRDRIYFSVRIGGEAGDPCNAIIVYDTTNGTFMLRTGFTCSCLCADNGKLYMAAVAPDRINIMQWGEQYTDYNGQPINAYWQTPLSDLGSMAVKKALKWLYFRATGGFINFRVRIGDSEIENTYQPEGDGDVGVMPLYNEGRVLSVRISNEKGSNFTLLGGIEVVYEQKGD